MAPISVVTNRRLSAQNCSCIDDPTSFYNIALTNRRLLQVTKSAKSAHHKNLLLLNSEYFIKCLVVESGDDSKLRWLTTVCFVLFCFFQFKVDRLQIIVVAKKYIYMSQLFISRMPKMRAIPQNYWFRLHSIGTLRSDNGDGDGNVRSLGRAGRRRVGVPAKIEITNFTSENVDDGH